MLFLLIARIAFNRTSLTGKEKQNGLTLRFSLVVLRHGERAPNKFYNHLIDGPGFVVKSKELTKKGAESNYEIGKQLREKF